jgi:uncharacterized protein with HEPN domain
MNRDKASLLDIVKAAQKILEFRSQYPEIPWKEIAGMRDIVTHQYDRVNFNTLWDVIQNDIPEILIFIEPLLPDRW